MAIAAIVQDETGTEEDMPLISAVVLNRLVHCMQLQMDSMCFYVLGEEGTFLNNDQRKRLETDWQVDFSYSIPNMARFRVNAYVQRASIGAGTSAGRVESDIGPIIRAGIRRAIRRSWPRILPWRALC